MKQFIYFILLLTLTACGFEPVYKDATWSGNSSPSAKSLQSVDIAVISNREGQTLRNELIDRFYRDGYPSAPLYRLETTPIAETIVEIGIDKDDNASRAQMRQSAEFKLVQLSNNQTVLKRTVRATTGYNILLGQFTTFVTENDARTQGIRTLSDNITTQLELYFTRKN